ncbi:MAG: zinc ABC transporter substrate-binding protein [Deltaproteobacteria bacterium]|nr:zinc ABC transporter substrate-binding protein [Deltaproteobacteria bacterium]
MNNKKIKHLSLLVILLSALTVPAGLWAAPSGKVALAVSIAPQAYFVERIGGDRVDVEVMIPGGVSPETYEPTPQQLVRLSSAQIYMKVGVAGLPAEKRFVDAVAGRGGGVAVVDMFAGAAQRRGDPHIWLSPSAVRLAAGNIERVLSAHDPGHEDEYRRNLGAFARDIDELDEDIRSVFAGLAGFSFMVYHPAWGYFADEYGLVQLAIEEEGKRAGLSHIRKMIDLAKKKGIRVILVQEGFDTKSAQSIARQIGGEVRTANPLERDWLVNTRNFARLLKDIVRK